ncbi:pyruvate kinase [Pseudomonadota bacterium]
MSTTLYKNTQSNACENLIGQLESLRQSIADAAEAGQDVWQGLPPGQQPSAENLLHYLALRSRDLRPLQDELASLGLSSLGRAEPHVMASITAVLHNLYLLSGNAPPGTDARPTDIQLSTDTSLLEQNTVRLLGARPTRRRAHIMVTMSSEAADDYLLVHQLLKAGMSCLRINCAHDDPATWSRTIEHIRNAERVTGRSCRILMDLSGPKLRTGAMEPVPDVIKIRPVRDEHGQVLRPARIWLTAEELPQHGMEAADANIALERNWLSQLMVGDRLRFKDRRGSRRNWRIREVAKDGCWAEAGKTAYISNGTVLSLRGDVSESERKTIIGKLPPKDSIIHLRCGDVLHISGRSKPGKSAIHDDMGNLMSPGVVSLPIPEIYRDARPGERICFDDGRIAGIIEKNTGKQLQIRITHTRKPVERLTRDKGVNLPDTELTLPALGARDLEDLEFAARHADIIGLSFANRPEDVRDLRLRLRELGCEHVGVIMKIETKRGFANLPHMLFEALKFPACGVMIARGDLGVECGFERLSEVQEEILWVCEAAHVPVIWATQVLEGLTKSGHASRAEITDAAMSQSAECVMLNKGPYIIEAVRTLDDILRRMQGHHFKKRSMLRELHLATAFNPPANAVREIVSPD